jgi:DNA-binding LacI/PurR family transcriptional regulator
MFSGHSPITVITCEDKIKNDDDREIAFREASAATGSPIDRTYFITNYTTQNSGYSLQTEEKAVDIIDTALLSAERYVKIQKLREEHHGSSTGAQLNNEGKCTIF